MSLTSCPTSPDDSTFTQTLIDASLPTSDLTEPGQLFFAFADTRQPVGYGGFLLTGADVLLRSIVVDDVARGAGRGLEIVEALVNEARSAGARSAWLLTGSAEGFFVKAGFNRVARENAPEQIRETKQFSGICPDSAAFMHREIGG